jgi:2-furoyl-CoA dehydrogenase 2Fe-2S iron sulfur subunit
MLRVAPGEKVRIEVTVNGRVHTGHVEGRRLLSDFLRHDLHLYGTRVGCEHGVCGACTVLIDGRPARSCATLAVQADGAKLTTVEGLAEGEGLNALQTAFSRHGALQCGFCTAGILISATRYLEEEPAPTEESVRSMLTGHICRCTGYRGMVEAILDVATSTDTGGGDR